MLSLSHVRTSIAKASADTTHYMGAHLRSEASASGWPDHIVRSMHVTHGAPGFEAHVHEDHFGHAQDLEYGTPDARPTAAVRRFANRTQQHEHFLVSRLEHYLGAL